MKNRISSLAYRTILCAFPSSIRQRFGAGMIQLLNDHISDARSTGRSVMLVCLSAVWDMLVQGTAARWAMSRSERRARRLTRNERKHPIDTHQSIGGRGSPGGPRQFFAGLGQDLKISWRQVSKRPGFAVLAIVILGLGIGASTTMFSVVESVLLEPLPYPNSQRLVYVGNTRGGAPIRTSAPEFLALRRETRTLESYTAYYRMNCGVILNDRPEQLLMSGVTEDYVDVFGAYPVLGRAFSEEDFHSGATPVALLSHAAWQRHWGGARR